MATYLEDTKYIINQTDAVGTMMGKETLDITNCYLVFRKFELEKKKNLDVPFNNILDKSYFMTPRDYVQAATKNILDYIAELYEGLSYTNNHIIKERYLELNIEEIISENFRFLFLKSKNDLILLNYINIYENFLPDFPLEIKDSHKFKRDFVDERFEPNEFLVVNTFKPFLKFADAASIEPNISLNEPFFNEFVNSLKNGKMYEDSGRYYCVLSGYNKVFSFYCFNNKMVVSDCTIF